MDHQSTHLVGGPGGNLSQWNSVQSITVRLFPGPARARRVPSGLYVNKWTSYCLPAPSKLVFIRSIAQYHQAYQLLVKPTLLSVRQFLSPSTLSKCMTLCSFLAELRQIDFWQTFLDHSRTLLQTRAKNIKIF